MFKYKEIRGYLVEKSDKLQKLGIIAVIIIGIITTYFQINPPQTQEQRTASNTIFFVVLFYIALYFVSDWVTDKVKSYLDKINTNQKDITDLKEKFNLEKRFNEIEKKIEVLNEKMKNKKGSIDPRIVIMIILLLLFYLYLRSIGLFGN